MSRHNVSGSFCSCHPKTYNQTNQNHILWSNTSQPWRKTGLFFLDQHEHKKCNQKSLSVSTWNLFLSTPTLESWTLMELLFPCWSSMQLCSHPPKMFWAAHSVSSYSLHAHSIFCSFSQQLSDLRHLTFKPVWFSTSAFHFWKVANTSDLCFKK